MPRPSRCTPRCAPPPSRTRRYYSLASLGASAPRQIASITKCLTAAVVLGIVDAAVAAGGEVAAHFPAGLHTEVQVSSRAASHVPGGTTAGLLAGERVTLWALLHGMMLPSGNDAAVALAEAVGPLCAPLPEAGWVPWAAAPHYAATDLVALTAHKLGTVVERGYMNCSV